ncbi:Erythropoietin [Dissostichus eleginoides]|uniref:Erythropoietin n=1 Tax=Dissostichus eleginoides TaxID=100907 RepID=A0AAD9CJA0_DISEL|nr:Erythropoietin [Dissostichus eleginoides]
MTTAGTYGLHAHCPPALLSSSTTVHPELACRAKGSSRTASLDNPYSYIILDEWERAGGAAKANSTSSDVWGDSAVIDLGKASLICQRRA